MANPTTDVAPELQVVEACWTALARHTLVEQVWPRQESVFGIEALHRWAPEAYESLSLKHALIERFGIIPIIAVVGLLNSGKSSLTASLLSSESRSRVLRGMGKPQGSQRFTLWIPHRWMEDTSFYNNLTELLTRVFGSSPEPLAADDEQARRQQNDLSALQIPLIAADAALSDRRLAIFDCPDIQRAQQSAQDNLTRLDIVSRAAEICAAVMVVFARNQIEIRDLQHILAQMPDARRVYAVNLIRNESAGQVRKEAAAILNLRDDDTVFGAYDFLASQYAAHAPCWDPNLKRDPEARLAASQPCFFEILSDDDANQPAAIDHERSLLEFNAKLSPGALQGRRLQEIAREFFKTVATGLDAVEKTLDANRASLQDASKRLLDECRHLMTKDGHLRITMSPDIVASVEQSLARTASISYRWLLLPPRKFLQACAKVVEKGKSLSPMPGRELKAKKAEMERKWQMKTDSKIAAGVVSVDDLGRMLSLWSGATGDYRAPETWLDEAQTILERFAAEDKTNLSDAEWDQLTTNLWKQVPGKARRRLMMSACLMLGGVMLAFVDGGVSLVTIHAMDVVGGLGVLASLGMNLRGAKEFQQVLDEKLGLRQVSNFHAIVCDTVGLPRDVGNDHDLPAPSVPTRLISPSYGADERHWCHYRLQQETLTELRSYGL